MSSRNTRLSAADRARAIALHQGLLAAERAIASGERDAERLRAAAEAAMREFEVEPEYIALVDPDTFSPTATVNGRVLVAVAARVGDVRLIDNRIVLSPARRSQAPAWTVLSPARRSQAPAFGDVTKGETT